jgi:hypothetical protein
MAASDATFLTLVVSIRTRFRATCLHHAKSMIHDCRITSQPCRTGSRLLRRRRAPPPGNLLHSIATVTFERPAEFHRPTGAHTSMPLPTWVTDNLRSRKSHKALVSLPLLVRDGWDS